jgi:hypothetical protein
LVVGCAKLLTKPEALEKYEKKEEGEMNPLLLFQK